MFGRAHVSRLKGDMLTSTKFQPLVRLVMLVRDSLNNQINGSLNEIEPVFMSLEVSQPCIQIDMGN